MEVPLPLILVSFTVARLISAGHILGRHSAGYWHPDLAMR